VLDDIHARSLRAAPLTGERLEITDPGESEDVGIDWADPRALDSFGERQATEPWTWHGPARSVTGRAWGGCLEVIEWILTAGRFPFSGVLSEKYRRHSCRCPHDRVRSGHLCRRDRPCGGG
jgi:hypothetical protein